VKLLLTEDGSGRADELWTEADELLTARLTYVEARAALAAASRARRLSPRLHAVAKAELEARWPRLALVELDQSLAGSAGGIAESFRLRANDAVYLAAALELGDPELVVATWDDRLRAAALAAGLAVSP
jgi:predicted nucleic acid-binding protein